MTADAFAHVREEVARACRVMAARDLAPGILGHISVRIDEHRMAVRCRHPEDRGLAWTTAEDVRVVRFDGSAGGDGELELGHVPPFELPIHARILRRRPDVSCVVHAHPADVVAADLAGIEIRPIVGAFDIPGSVLARDGVPVYPRAVLVRNSRLGNELADHLADKAVVVMRGHGMTAVGASAAEAVLRAISLNQLAKLSLSVATAGGVLRDISDADVAELPDLGSGLNATTAWRHELARLDDARTHR